MESLNNNQIILLTLLVSFITSIATGIVTVTLIDQAPPAVTQTINRVVERTIEKVVPGEPKVSTVVKEVPVIVTEEQLIVDIIGKASPGMVRVADSDAHFITSGFVASTDGLIITASGPLPAATSTSISNGYTVLLGDNTKIVARRIDKGDVTGVAVLKLDTIPAGVPKPLSILENNPAEADKILPGQTIVAVGVTESGQINVSGGIVSTVFSQDEGKSELVKTNAANASNLGGPVLNLKGKVIGLNKEAGVAVSAKMLQQALVAVK
jgi:S1-C subfamily serine protease